MTGGGEESRTPVRKPISTAFYERRRSIGFPIMRAGRQAHITGSLSVHAVPQSIDTFTFTAD